MVFNSLEFLLFLPVVTVLFYILPAKIRKYMLLLASYYFYMSWNKVYVLLILGSTIVTYIGSLLIEANKKKKLTLTVVLAVNLGILGVFKYYNFFVDSFISLLRGIGIRGVDSSTFMLNVLLPVGISFYTFQALSYTLDVYYGKTSVEKNFVNYALFVSFFPQLVAGPIERTKNLLPQIKNIENERYTFEKIYENIRNGFVLILWGLFQKIVIADRIAVYVDSVYDNYEIKSPLALIIATLLFGIQIYCDFNGYSTMARGSAKFLGINLMHNFRMPYLAGSVRDFWKRWHISLTTWFTDYVYILLGGSRVSAVRHLLNIVIVFLISGLWHGAAWHYVLWGACHAIFQCVEVVASKRPTKKIPYFLGLIYTNVLVSFAWIFFRADNLGDAFGIIGKTIGLNGMDLGLGLEILDKIDLAVLIFALIILLLVDVTKEILDVKNFDSDILLLKICGLPMLIRVLIISLLMWICIMFGVYGVDYSSAQFIYFQF